ncbi:MAG: hypothetical protein ChlgKO_07890 [Chlamydiales bacterium]
MSTGVTSYAGLTTGPFRLPQIQYDLMKEQEQNALGKGSWAIVGPGCLLRESEFSNTNHRLRIISPLFPSINEVSAFAPDGEKIFIFDNNPNLIGFLSHCQKNCPPFIKSLDQNAINNCFQQFNNVDSKLSAVFNFLKHNANKHLEDDSIIPIQHDITRGPIQLTERRKLNKIFVTFVLCNISEKETALLSLLSSLKNRGTLYIDHNNDYASYLTSVFEQISSYGLEVSEEILPIMASSKDSYIIPNHSGPTTSFPDIRSVDGTIITKVSADKVLKIRLEFPALTLADTKSFRNNTSEYWLARANEVKNLTDRAKAQLDVVKVKTTTIATASKHHQWTPLHIAAIRLNHSILEYFATVLPKSSWRKKDEFGKTPINYYKTAYILNEHSSFEESARKAQLNMETLINKFQSS